MNSLRRLVPLLAVGVLLLGAALSALLATPQIRPVSPPKPPVPTIESTNLKTVPPVAPAADGPTAPDHPAGVQMPAWLMGIAQVLCLVAVIGVVVLVFWLLLRSGLRTRERKLTETPAADPKETREHVIAAVDAGLTQLDDSDTDPRRAVIACWVRLEQAAAAAGTPRAPGDTPTDLVGRLLAEQQVSAAVLYPLAEVYRLARYASHTVDTGMRDQARAALGQLRAELSRTPAKQVVG
jgi:Domain of unknown function (DUF4129)